MPLSLGQDDTVAEAEWRVIALEAAADGGTGELSLSPSLSPKGKASKGDGGLMMMTTL